jgi:methionyl-tRNA synthetase
MPESCEKIFAQIGAGDLTDWDSAESFGKLPENVTVSKGDVIFPRIDMEKELKELEELTAAPQEPEVDPVLPDVTIDDFAKCDMRVCKIINCEPVKKSAKLLKFTLNDGSKEPRQILSGIAKFYKPEELIGKTVVAILNLPPRKMMGLDSNGMLLSAVKEENGEEKLHLVMLDDSVPAGYRLS